MGTAAGRVQEVDVAYVRSHYPSPSTPRFNFKELYKNIPLHDDKDLADEGFDWVALEFALKAEEYKKVEEKTKGTDAEIQAVFDANLIAKQQDSNRTDRKHGKHKYSKDKHEQKKSMADKRETSGDDESALADNQSGVLSPVIPMMFNSRRKIDQHAREARPDISKMFDTLFAYLKQPIKKGFYPQTFFVRALMAWLGYQNIEKEKYGPTSLDSPDGILAHLQCTSLTYAKAFTLLCRAAGIHCSLIDGFVKAGSYEPGDMLNEDAEDTWCAVFVDDSWQLVHPLWICRGCYGRRVPGCVHIDSRDVLSTVQQNTKEKVKRQIIFNEDFFMPPPEEFVNKCYASDVKWQLLPAGKTIKSQKDFIQLAYVTATFVKLGLNFIGDPSSTLHVKHGKVSLEIAAPVNLASRLVFKCSLAPHSITTEGVTSKEISATDYSKLVLSFRSNDRFIFDIRSPFEGTYRLEISGGLDTLYCLSRFIIICEEPMSPCIPLPVDTGSLGWGPGPVAERHGLILPSNPSGFISILPTEGDRIIPPSYAKPENVINISFQLGRRAMLRYDYSADLRASYSLAATYESITKNMKRDVQKAHTAKAAQNLGRCVEGIRDHQQRLLKFKITVPRDGEYALVIKATEFVIKQERKIVKSETTSPICFYLLSARDDWAKQYTPEKLARRELHNAMSEANIELLQRAIVKCKGAKIPVVDNAIAAAELRIEHMKLQKDLDDSIKRRNGVVINDTLKKVLKYRYRSAFVDEIEQLLQFKDALLRLNGYPRGIYSLKEANEEIVKVSKPLPEVHNTMKALLLMLGYYGNMDDWLVIQSTIKVAPDTLEFKNILKQMEELDSPSFPWKHINVRHMEKVKKVLHKHSYERVFRANQAAALFYEWIERCLTRVPKKEDEAEETRGAAASSGQSAHRHRRRRHRHKQR